jgi:sec-independent protein translocase protein TatA
MTADSHSAGLRFGQIPAPFGLPKQTMPNHFPGPLPLAELFGSGEMVVIFLLVLIFFGGEKLPEFARGLGKVMREFKKASSGIEAEIKKAMDEHPTPPYVPPRSANLLPPPPTVEKPVSPAPVDPTPGHRIMEHPLPVDPAPSAVSPVPEPPLGAVGVPLASPLGAIGDPPATPPDSKPGA